MMQFDLSMILYSRIDLQFPLYHEKKLDHYISHIHRYSLVDKKLEHFIFV